MYYLALVLSISFLSCTKSPETEQKLSPESERKDQINTIDKQLLQEEIDKLTKKLATYKSNFEDLRERQFFQEMFAKYGLKKTIIPPGYEKILPDILNSFKKILIEINKVNLNETMKKNFLNSFQNFYYQNITDKLYSTTEREKFFNITTDEFNSFFHPNNTTTYFNEDKKNFFKNFFMFDSKSRHWINDDEKNNKTLWDHLKNDIQTNQTENYLKLSIHMIAKFHIECGIQIQEIVSLVQESLEFFILGTSNGKNNPNFFEKSNFLEKLNSVLYSINSELSRTPFESNDQYIDQLTVIFFNHFQELFTVDKK